AVDRGIASEFASHAAAAEEICVARRFPRERVLIEELRGEEAARAGRLEEAEARLRGALRSAREIASGGDAAVTVLLRLADLLLARGDAEQAEKLALEVAGPVAAVADPWLEGFQRRILAGAALAGGDFGSAADEIAGAIRLFERIGARADLARSFVTAGRIEIARGGAGARERALASFLSAKRIGAEIGDLALLGRASIETSRCWLAAGAAAEAAGALRDASEAFDRAGDEEGAAEARALLEEVGPRSDAPRSPFASIVTRDPATLETLRIAERVSVYPVTVLIEGETGTGKQLLARAIHEASRRAAKSFVTVNCASLPEQLLESELFGYVKGAFTGAIENRKGLFEEADGGTIFLDEIGKAGPHVQRSLLHVLDQGIIRPIGSTRTRTVDARVICATSNLGLRRDIQEDRFLKDLFYRINDITLRLPPLRERRGDAALLARHFLGRFRAELGRPDVRFSGAVERLFERYPWPGNVREMEKAILRSVLLASGDRIELDHLPADLIFEESPESGAAANGLKEEVEALEVRRVAEVLDRTEWNRSRAARELGLSLRGLRNKIRRYRLDKPARSARFAR
ncbi:MAG: AAA family ATPase, partial [Candidatus Latescibacterota bacterium]